jgi:hypothetical protein
VQLPLAVLQLLYDRPVAELIAGSQRLIFIQVQLAAVSHRNGRKRNAIGRARRAVRKTAPAGGSGTLAAMMITAEFDGPMKGPLRMSQ